jgi:hypothetical protein
MRRPWHGVASINNSFAPWRGIDPDRMFALGIINLY